MKIVIELDPITKKNSQRLIYAGGRPRIIPSKQFVDYQKSCGLFLVDFGSIPPIDYPVTVKCLFYRRTKRRGDLTNYLEAIDDILVHYGILRDDSFNIIASHDGSRVLLDRARPRTEIEILPFSDQVDI